MLFFHLQKETKLLNFLNRKTLGPVILGGNATPAIMHSCCKRLTEPAKERSTVANAKEACPTNRNLCFSESHPNLRV